jgi:hypothetical protein
MHTTLKALLAIMIVTILIAIIAGFVREIDGMPPQINNDGEPTLTLPAK